MHLWAQVGVPVYNVKLARIVSKDSYVLPNERSRLMPITENDLAGLRDGNVISSSGDKIGSIGQVYLDDQTGEPTFVTANTGLFGMKQSFVPLQGARVQDGDVIVDYDKDTVKDAPRIDDDGSLTPEEEDQLYSYYGLGGVGTTTDGYDTTGYDAGTATDTGYADTGTRTDAGYADTGRTTDAGYADTGTRTDAGYADAGTRTDAGYAGTGTDTGTGARYDEGADRTSDVDTGTDRGTVGDENAMTLSEERVNVGTETRETGRARLRKYVVTENVTQTVPVQREEVRLEREPITDENVGDATTGPDFTESEHEVTLTEERPVVEKEAVPVERVRLATDTVTDEATVSEDVRKEAIDSDVDVDRPDRRDI
jgi:uncharacterized protein (TIGR02271 family)